MKKNYSFLVPAIAMLILSVISEKSLAQPYPPPLPDQHGYNGNPSPQSAPLDNGTEVLLTLGIVYLARKVAESKKNTVTVQ